MPLDKFISSVRAEVAKRFDLKTDAEIDAFFIGIEESAKDNQEALEKRDKMLRDTVEELCEAKRLLKAAVEDIGTSECCWICTGHKVGNCVESGRKCTEWKHKAEALKLIGEEGERE